jgi:hypothetical protein
LSTTTTVTMLYTVCIAATTSVVMLEIATITEALS